MDADDSKAFFQFLYNEELYVVDEPEPAKPVAETSVKTQDPEPHHPKISLNNNKTADLLLLFSYPAAQNPPAADEELITKALAAANISYKNIAWLNTAAYPELHWTDIETAGPATKIIAFGIKPKLLPVLLTEGELKEENGKQILLVASLAEINENKERKKLLWEGMKRMLNI